MATKNSKPTELTDIPLTLEQGDNVGMGATKPDKLKTNSLKRFFRTAKGGTGGSMASTTDGGPNTMLRTDTSFQMRFGSFRKADDLPTANDELEAGSSADPPVSKLPNSDSRLSLHERLSSFWNNVFKKTSKKSTEDKDNTSQESDIVPSNELNPIEQNQSEKL